MQFFLYIKEIRPKEIFLNQDYLHTDVVCTLWRYNTHKVTADKHVMYVQFKFEGFAYQTYLNLLMMIHVIKSRKLDSYY